jgi:hypothetical protein
MMFQTKSTLNIHFQTAAFGWYNEMIYTGWYIMKAESLKQDTIGSALSILYQQMSLSTEPGGRSIEINGFFVQTIFAETVELTRTAYFKHFCHNPNKRIKFTPIFNYVSRHEDVWGLEAYFHAFLNSLLRVPADLPQGKSPHTHWIMQDLRLSQRWLWRILSSGI